MPARLHYDRIASVGRDPERWLVMTHGIYGAGSNWRGIARKVVAARPEWGIALVDLRGHGRSELGAPPHDLGACAGDLAAVAGEIGGVEALCGHSFGGKAVLAARELVRMRQTWVLDASPSARPADPSSTVARVLEVMERLPRRWAKRDDFVAALVAEGHPEPLAHWLAMNVVPEPRVPGAGLVLRLDLGVMRALLADYQARDLWRALEDPRGGAVEIVISERESALNAADRARLAAAPPHVHVHHVDAGHWLHIDAPDAVVALFAAHLP
jgi:pimeloyl-ACP methyl ester carboxylesterase